MWDFTFQWGQQVITGHASPPTPGLWVALTTLAPIAIAATSLILSLVLFGALRRQERNRVLIEAMRQYVELQRDDRYRPTLEVIRLADVEQLTNLVAFSTATFPEEARPHIQRILGRPFSANSDVRLDDPSDIGALRRELFRVCNVTEAICATYRLGLVSRSKFLEEFRHVLVRDDETVSLMNFIRVRNKHYPSIRSVLKDIDKGFT